MTSDLIRRFSEFSVLMIIRKVSLVFLSGIAAGFLLSLLLVPASLVRLGIVDVPQTRPAAETAGVGRQTTFSGGAEADIALPENATFVFPVADSDWKITSPWGVRMSPIYQVYRFHTGIDISVKGERNMLPQIVSIADGYVEEHWFNHPTRGKYIVINHGWGRSHYFHMSETYVHERNPDGSPWKVKAGTIIGRMGDTGAADGAHLHFELEIFTDKGPKFVNPMLYLNKVLPEWDKYFAQLETDGTGQPGQVSSATRRQAR